VKPEEYQRMYALEDQHWWFRGKRNLVQTLIERYFIGTAKNSSNENNLVLDVGCGTGKTLEELSAYGTSIGFDINNDSLTYCHSRGHRLIFQATAETPPFNANLFDLACMLDVLYHREINDDLHVLKNIFCLLKPGGVLLLTDSAFQFLYSQHDCAVHARQRYSKKEMVDKLIEAGFIIERSGYYNFFLFPLAAIYRLLTIRRNKNKVASDLFMPPAFINTLLESVLYLEARLLMSVDFPFGLSLFAVARKPQDLQPVESYTRNI
jgi:SAM-dependent methyltransferase